MGLLNYTTAETNNLLDKVNEMPDEVKDGKTPVFVIGTVSTLDPGMSATASVTLDGTDDQGNPKYKLNLGIPKGLDGAGGGGGGVADSVQWTNVLNKPTWLNRSTKPTYTASEVGAMPATTIIPSKVSQLTNDSGYLTSSGFKTINGQSIVGSGNIVIESSGGGDTPSEEGGNVKVTNASSLSKAGYYAFKPSANGSLEGTFSVIPEANEDSVGLMSAADKAKLDDIRLHLKFPIAVASLTGSSSSEQIRQALGPDFVSGPALLLYMMMAYQGIQAGEYSSELPEAYIGNYRVDILFTFDSETQSGTMALTYVASGGKLRTITISGKEGGASPDYTYTYSCAVTESGDDTYYLPIAVSLLNAGATAEKIKDAFGGEEIFMEAVKAASNRKKLYIYGSSLWLIPVSASVPFDLTGYFAFLHVESERTVIKHISSSTVICVYPSGYSLSASLYALTPSSTSDEISTSVGGESGLKAIIQAVKDGNRLVIRGTLDDFAEITINQDVQCSMYKEADNGDIALLLSGRGYLLWGTMGGTLNIIYTKSSNTFSCKVETD